MSNRSRNKKFMGVDLLLSGRPTVTSGQAGEILGFSRWTVLRRLQKGYYSDVGRCKAAVGWIFDMEDIIRTGYPVADDAQVTMLMKEYRDRFREARRRRRY